MNPVVKRLVMKERERVKAIVVRKIDAVIESREKSVKSARRRLSGRFEQLKDDIVFLIETPDYVRKIKSKEDSS